MKLKILIINKYDQEKGGVKRFISEFYTQLKKRHDVDIIKPNELRLNELKKYDILHVSGVSSLKLFKLLFFRNKLILTVHGWINREHFNRIKTVKFKDKILWTGHWILWKLFLKPIKYITCPTKNTLIENKLESRAMVIPNAIDFKDYLNIPKISRKNLNLKNDDFVFFAYSSSGGNKNESVKSAINLISELNKINKRIKLLIFGEYNERIESEGVIYLGYRNDFLNIIKSCDAFLCTKGFPDLGYVEMQSAALNIPIIKFYQDYDGRIYPDQEINEKNGFLVKDDNECKELILYLIKNKNTLNKKGRTFRNYVYNNYSWNKVIKKWEELFILIRKNNL